MCSIASHFSSQSNMCRGSKSLRRINWFLLWQLLSPDLSLLSKLMFPLRVYDYTAHNVAQQQNVQFNACISPLTQESCQCGKYQRLGERRNQFVNLPGLKQEQIQIGSRNRWPELSGKYTIHPFIHPSSSAGSHISFTSPGKRLIDIKI